LSDFVDVDLLQNINNSYNSSETCQVVQTSSAIRTTNTDRNPSSGGVAAAAAAGEEGGAETTGPS
jgi:hypothetical protein